MSLTISNRFRIPTKTFLTSLALIVAISAALLGLARYGTVAQASKNTVNPWWPVEGSRVAGVQPFKANVENIAVEKYDMYWQVDEGARNAMPSNYSDYPHKEASVDLSNWNWRGSGPYKITYTAIRKKDRRRIASRSFNIYIDSGSSAAPKAEEDNKDQGSSEPIVLTPSEPTPAQAPVVGTGLSGLSLYGRPLEPALRQAAQWVSEGRTKDSEIMKRLANMPHAEWLGGWSGDVEVATRNFVNGAPENSLPVLVAYNIPHRDCGSYSAGGVEESQYIGWIKGVANGIGSHSAMVILEPDALAAIDCLNATSASKRMDLLRQAVTTLKSNANTRVYLDAGNPAWLPVDKISDLLGQAGVAKADGFSLNVSNFTTTEVNINYGSQISAKTGGAHFVIDTSRNGNGPAPGNEWCNPAGRALGRAPTTQTGNGLVDAFVWAKTPGESDGNCNGAPNAGEWMPDYALGLAKNAGW